MIEPNFSIQTMLKRLQPFILAGNLVLLLAMLAFDLGSTVDIIITSAIVLGSGYSVWADWCAARCRRLEQEALRRLAPVVIDRHIESAIQDYYRRQAPIQERRPEESVYMLDARGQRVAVGFPRFNDDKAIGDPTCRYSANSRTIRCAVNPSGPCDRCAHYQLTDDLVAWVAFEAKLRKAARKLDISYEDALARFSSSFAPDPELEATIAAVEADGVEPG